MALALSAPAALARVAASEPPISIWLPLGVPATKVQTTPLTVMVLAAAGWLANSMPPAAATVLVVGSPISAVSQKPLPWRSSGTSIWPSSVTSPR